MDKGSGDCFYNKTKYCCSHQRVSDNDELFRKYRLPFRRIRSGEIIWSSVCKEYGASYYVWQSSMWVHLLGQSALTFLLLDKCTSWKDSQDDLCLVFSNLQQGELSINEVNDSVNVIKVQNIFETGKLELFTKSHTAKLWIQHLDYTATLKMYIKAKRIRNWTMHLECTCKVLNLFAGTGIVNCAKSARLYVQRSSMALWKVL